jgi:hypothetical protein
MWLQLGASLSLIVPVAEAVPEAIVKSSLFSSISAVVGTLTVPVVAPAGTVYCCSSVISTSSSSIGECKGIVYVDCRRVAQVN